MKVLAKQPFKLKEPQEQDVDTFDKDKVRAHVEIQNHYVKKLVAKHIQLYNVK